MLVTLPAGFGDRYWTKGQYKEADQDGRWPLIIRARWSLSRALSF